MDSSKSVVTIKEYGRISIHLKELMDSKGITRNYLARVSNTRFEVINKWYHGVVEKMDSIFSPASAMCLNARLPIS